MLQEIHIGNQATYTGDPQALTGLKPLNFVFGTNGSGKTTISRVIADPAATPACMLVWANDRALERLVYNSDFVDNNFASQLPGIFTLGEAELETLQKIDGAKAEIDEIERDLDKLRGALGPTDGSTGKRAELKILREGFENTCWQIKTAHDPHFKEAFAGLRASKTNFCDRVLSELETNTAGLVPLDELKQRAKTVFAENLDRLTPLLTLDGRALIELEQAPVLAKRVVGKNDIDIAALIRRLGNSDWVRQGLTYVNEAGAQCPFCQQDIDNALFAKLNAYFDETYLADIDAIDRVRDAYDTHANDLVQRVGDVLASGSQHIDADALRADLDRLTARIRVNQAHLERKRKEPSASVALEGLSEIPGAINSAIATANDAVAAHNALVDNLATERRKLNAEIWRCLLDASDAPIQAFTAAKKDLDKGMAGLTAGIDAKTAQLESAKVTLIELERSITSVQPTVIEINAILASFGFTSFKLASAGEHDNLYAIVRGDGSDATRTLSEGERSFITFLYFFHLIRGSTNSSGMTVDRVVVFDDPVSSLDSDVLFVVSSLIRSVVTQACKGRGPIKQVFVLTHNIYFHKEVSFDSKRNDVCRTHETFWIVRKIQDHSMIEGFSYNPIKTSYELLWQEVKNPQHSRMTIQNTLRRILEHYFTILGNLDRDTIIAKFTGKDQQFCAALFSWINDGSHNHNDDLYVSAADGVVERYLEVFKRIFEVTDHWPHYRMMMGIDDQPPGAEVLTAVASNFPQAKEAARPVVSRA